MVRGVEAPEQRANTWSEADDTDTTGSTYSMGSTHLSRAELHQLMARPDIKITDKIGAGATRPPRHHLFPQPYREWFWDNHRIDIDRYTIGDPVPVGVCGCFPGPRDRRKTVETVWRGCLAVPITRLKPGANETGCGTLESRPRLRRLRCRLSEGAVGSFWSGTLRMPRSWSAKIDKAR